MKTSQSYLKLTTRLLLFLFIYQTPTVAQTPTTISAVNDTVYITSLDDISINVLLNDIGQIDKGTNISIVSESTYGTAERNVNNTVTYTPSSNFIIDNLNDSFSYIINGSSNEAEVFIIADCPACVWPGDTNRDGKVDVWDLLPIGLAYGSEGAPRNVQSQGTNWSGYPTAENWGETLYGSDYKYIDCNGNGTINEDDVAAIDQNYQASHDFAPPPPLLPAAGNEPFNIVLYIENTEPISWGDTVTFDIKTGLAGQPSTLYGIAFSFSPPQGFIQSAEIDFSNSEIGTADSTISLSKNIILNDSTRFDAAIVRTNQSPITFNNEISLGKINVVMVEVLEGKTGDFEETIIFNLDNFMAVNENGEILDIVLASDDILFVGTKNIVQEQQPHLKVYPNPTQDILSVDLPPLHDLQSLEIIDISGKTVLQQDDLQLFTDKINIDTKDLSNGFYLLKMQNAETQITQKISVLRH